MIFATQLPMYHRWSFKRFPTHDWWDSVNLCHTFEWHFLPTDTTTTNLMGMLGFRLWHHKFTKKTQEYTAVCKATDNYNKTCDKVYKIQIKEALEY